MLRPPRRRHINALERNAQLTWLKAPVPDGECRILSNARCLSEGVDVPALDAVMFLHPRNSVVEVVQSVGRVMRLNPGKDYGYIILPVAVPSGITPEKALADNKRFKVVWQVLNALRAHDDRFNAMVNSIELNKGQRTGQKGNDQLLGGHIGPTYDPHETIDSDGAPDTTSSAATATAVLSQPALFSLDRLARRYLRPHRQERRHPRLLGGLGPRRRRHRRRPADPHQGHPRQQPRPRRRRFASFVTALRGNLNNAVTDADAISMLSQHLITRPVFEALFADYDFAAHNPVSQTMQAMVDGSKARASTPRPSRRSRSTTPSAFELRGSPAPRASSRSSPSYTNGSSSSRSRSKPSPSASSIPPSRSSTSSSAPPTTPCRPSSARPSPTKACTSSTRSPGPGRSSSGSCNPGSSSLTTSLASTPASCTPTRSCCSPTTSPQSTSKPPITASSAANYQPFDGIILTDTFQITEAGDATGHQHVPH